MKLLPLSILTTVLFVSIQSVNAQAVDLKKNLQGFTLQESQMHATNSVYSELVKGQETTMWWTQNISQTMLTAVIPNRLDDNAFEDNTAEWKTRLDELTAETNLGEISLRTALSDPRAASKAIIILHKGKLIYEAYPGMKPADNHLWASVAKPTASLLIEQLIDEGLIDEHEKVSTYLSDFADTPMGDTTVIQLMDMVPGTDTHDSAQTRQDPDSVATRYYRAEFGEPYKGKLETVRDILRNVKRTGPAGLKFEYSSGITQMLVFLAEAVTQQTWSDAFDQRVWSHVRAESALLVHLAPDGMAAAHGIVSSRLRDLARYGLLYTNYWSIAANKQVVSNAALDRIQKVHHKEAYSNGDGARFSRYLGEAPIGQSRQWDAVYEDGGMFKGGLFGQGLYVEPESGIVIAYYSTVHASPLHNFLRPIAKLIKDTQN